MGGWKKLTGVMAAVVLVAVVVAACGGGHDNTSTAGNGAAAQASDTPAVAAAKAEFKKWSAPQRPISVPPLGAPVPKGKRLAIVTCPLPVCHTETKASERAAKLIGWQSKTYNNPLTPEGYIAVWNEIVQSKPDGVIYVGVLPNVIIKSQLAKVAAAKIPTVVMAPAGDKPSKSGPVNASYAGAPNFGLSGRLIGATIVSDNGPKPKVALVWDKTLALTLAEERRELTQQVVAAGGTLDIIEVSSQQIGKAIPGQIVSYVQRHPDVKYLAFQLNDFTAGVPQALQAAGLAGKVKIASRAPQSTHLADIQSGNQFASVAEENDAGGWRSVDALIRLFLGKSDYDMEPAGWHQIITKANVGSVKPDESGAPSTPGSPATFLKAWGVKG
jgi:predicted small secreted protein